RWLSNSWLLEQHFGWTGLLVEPNPHWHADLARNRRAPVSPHAITGQSGQHMALAVPAADPLLAALAPYAAISNHPE
ncbi:hypothetical protein WB403_52300, partial [Streptomyces brasiliscabiei]